MKYFYALILVGLSFTLFGQQVTRIPVKGKILVTSGDKEGVAVYNTSSNRGTVSDEDGNFTIKVALNDVIEFSALQFEDFSITVNEKIIQSLQMTAILVEEVNKVDEVVLLPFGVTGDIKTDLQNVRTYNVSLDAVYFGLSHTDYFEFSPDYKTPVENTAFNDYLPRVENMVDFVNLANLVYDELKKDKNKIKLQDRSPLDRTLVKQKLEAYGFKFLETNFNIPTEQATAFISYVETKDIPENLLDKNQEVEFLERINTLSQEFLALQSGKN